MYRDYILYSNDYFRAMKSDIMLLAGPVYCGCKRKKLKGWQKQNKRRK